MNQSTGKPRRVALNQNQTILMNFRFTTATTAVIALMMSLLFGACSNDDLPKDDAVTPPALEQPGDSIEPSNPDTVPAVDKVAMAIALKSEICAITTEGHSKRTYKQLWTDFRTTDARTDGTVRDLYDNTTRYEFGTNQDDGTGRKDVYNREHSVPKSWWGHSSSNNLQNDPMYTDLFHLYPADRTANETRSNWPLGEVNGAISWTNGYCKLGQMTSKGYTGLVFEPADEIKGNLARTYFYFAARYEKANFQSWPEKYAYCFSRDAYPFYLQWSIDLFLKWNRLDPVDAEERERNAAVESIQGNRNPFIDDSELAEYIWGDKMGQEYNTSRVTTPVAVWRY